MSKIILDANSTGVRVCHPSATIMRAFTSGGLGALPGDAVTSDLATEGKRIEVSESMPIGRAIDNMVRDGRDPDWAARYTRALLSGGETDASGLELVRAHAFPKLTGQVAAERAALPADRSFRDAWRLVGGGITIDLTAARAIFAKEVIARKLAALTKMRAKIEVAVLTAAPSDELEAALVRLETIDLRALGAQIMAATTAEELKHLMPKGLE